MATDLLPALTSDDPKVVESALDRLAALGRKAFLAMQADEDEGEGDDDDEEDDAEDNDEDGADYDDDDDEADEGDDETNATIQAGGELPALDHALDQHLAQLSIATLGRVFAVLFQTCHDNVPAAARIAAEVARRGTEAEQLALVDAFIAANKRHICGHRSDDTVHAVVIDEVFPTLGPAALTRLLAWCTNKHLDDTYGDRMFALFIPALEQADDRQRTLLVQRLETFMREIAELQPAHAHALWDSLGPLRGAAGDAVGGLRSRLSSP